MVRVGPANHAGLSNREHTGVNWRIRLIRARRRCGRMSNYFDRLFITLCVICTARIVCGAFLCNGTASVRLSVCLSVRLSVCLSCCGPAAANPLLRVCCCGPGGQEISIDCRTAGARQQRCAAGECGQCHVVSVRRKLNTD